MLSVKVSSDLPSSTPCLSLSLLTCKHVIRLTKVLELSCRREDNLICFLHIDKILAVEMGWVQVEPTVPSSVNQSSDFLSSMLWVKTGRCIASHMYVDGKYKGLNISVCLTPTLQDSITRRLDTDSVKIWYLSEQNLISFWDEVITATHIDQGMVAIHMPREKAKNKTPPHTPSIYG